MTWMMFVYCKPHLWLFEANPGKFTLLEAAPWTKNGIRKNLSPRRCRCLEGCLKMKCLLSSVLHPWQTLSSSHPTMWALWDDVSHPQPIYCFYCISGTADTFPSKFVCEGTPHSVRVLQRRLWTLEFSWHIFGLKNRLWDQVIYSRSMVP